MIQPWRATCMQVYNHVVNRASNRWEALDIIDKSIDRWLQLVDSVAGRGSGNQLMLFPEFSLQGYPLKETAAEWIEKACFEIPGPETERFQRKAQELRVYIGLNAYEFDPEWPGRYFNCSFLIGPNGNILLKYRRINTVQTGSPHDFMDRYLDRYGIEGTFPVARTEIGNIAMMPCGEIMYPEAARMFMFRGAEVLLHPTSDHGLFDGAGWESAKIVRAAENMMYLVSANSTGQVGSPLAENNVMGNSKIIDYDGHVLVATGGPGESTRAAAMIDIEALRRARSSPGSLNRLLRQRIEIYRPLYNQTSFYPPNQFADSPMESKAKIMEIQREALGNMARLGLIPLSEQEHAPVPA